ncbi:LVIVD repeat-containing protein [Streptomyces sp. NPDC059917]|uniref:LVIVD repeat-containing protein n=1 Tax=Streptomyces sp. NPDC059917 TaxID=3347002 RepID=UPI0036481BAE
MRSLRTTAALATAVAVATVATLLAPGATATTAPTTATAKDPNIPDVCEDRRPGPADPGAYGMQLDGTFRHPALTPVDEEHEHSFPGRNEKYDTRSYIKNMKVEAAYEGADFTPDFFHTWQNVVDFDGRRYLFQYDRSEGRVYDITDVKKVTVVEKMSRGDVGGDESKANGSWAAGDYWGASTIQWNKKLGAYVMVQSFEDKRQISELTDEPGHDKYGDPAGVEKLRAKPGLKGFKVFRLDGPRKKDWKLLATVSTDSTQRDPLSSDPNTAQQGSGSLDVPYWTGEKYMFIATAPNDTYSGTEYPTNLHSAGYQSWDMSDPAHPKLLDTWHLPGQRTGEDAAYRANPRCGNRTSWMGARMPLFIPKPVEQGGRYAFAAMGGYGLTVLDISDPAHMKAVGHLDLPPSVSGTEGDNIDVSQYERTGMIYYSGYPLTEDCYEPYKDVYQIDAKDPKHPRVVGTLPRPTPPKAAGFQDFCQRRGSFGPKRTGYYTNPGKHDAGVLGYGFYNAGVQFFDVKNPARPEIEAYFVPKAYGPETPDYAYGNQTHGVYVEWDRNIAWVLTNHGIYALSSQKVLGQPHLTRPEKPFRNSEF